MRLLRPAPGPTRPLFDRRIADITVPENDKANSLTRDRFDTALLAVDALPQPTKAATSTGLWVRK